MLALPHNPVLCPWRLLLALGMVVIVIVIPIVVVATMVVVTIFFLVATSHFKDTGWVNLFEVGKMKENGP